MEDPEKIAAKKKGEERKEEREKEKKILLPKKPRKPYTRREKPSGASSVAQGIPSQKTPRRRVMFHNHTVPLTLDSPSLPGQSHQTVTTDISETENTYLVRMFQGVRGIVLPATIAHLASTLSSPGKTISPIAVLRRLIEL